MCISIKTVEIYLVTSIAIWMMIFCLQENKLIALEYSNPDIALSKIHKKHSNRLDQLSVVTKLVSNIDTYKIGRNICLIFILVSRHISSIKFFTWHLGTKLTKSLPNLNQNRFNDKILIQKQSLKFIIKNSNLSKHI